MTKNLKNKSILLFSPSFFGYEYKIQKKIQDLGGEVDMFDERSIKKNWQKALLKINPNIFNKMTERYYFDILKKIKNKKYDYILFIKCDMPTEKILSTYKETFKESKMILYMWDSIKNIPHIKEKFDYFDCIFSFDKNDCTSNQFIQFRPLFFCDEYQRDINNHNCLYDLCFIGTIHSDRYKILKRINQEATEKGLKIFFYPYLQSKFTYYFYKLLKPEFWGTKKSDFKYVKLSSKTISKIIDESNVIMDIQHPRQTGLTMRTIEILGLRKKLITTNKDIENYDFYNNNNIMIVDRDNFVIDKNFFDKKFINLDEKIYDKYSLNSWINTLIGDE